MTRITSTILVIMILMNGTVTIMSASGYSEDIGVELAPGVSDSMDDLIQNMKDGFSPDVSVVESLLSMLTAGMNFFKLIVEGIYAAPTMMINLGIPEWFIVPLFAPAYLLSSLEIVYIATGRDMI